MTKKHETLILSANVVARYLDGGTSVEADELKPSLDLIDRIDAVNGRAAAFTTSATEIAELVLEIEEQLDSAGLPNRARVGVTAQFRGPGPTAAAYKHAARATFLHLLRKTSGWFLTNAYTVGVYPKNKKLLQITLTEDQAEIVFKVALKPFRVALPTTTAGQSASA